MSVFISESDHEVAETQLEGDRCRRLFCAVLLQAITDGTERKWYESADAQTICSLAGLDHSALVSKLDGIMARRDPAKLTPEQRELRHRAMAKAWAQRRKMAVAAG